jgi:phosphopantothenoylcysteine synthetase/decarboxylase
MLEGSIDRQRMGMVTVNAIRGSLLRSQFAEKRKARRIAGPFDLTAFQGNAVLTVNRKMESTPDGDVTFISMVLDPGGSVGSRSAPLNEMP